VVVAQTRRRQAPEVRRDQILDAAEELVLNEGPRAMTMANVADAAGVAKGTTYLYFPSKEALLADLRTRYLRRSLEALGAGPGSAPRSQLRQLMTGLIEFGRAHRELHHRLFHEAGFSEADSFGDLRERLISILRSGSASGEFNISDVMTTATFLLHGAHGVLLHPGSDAPTIALVVADLVDRCVT